MIKTIATIALLAGTTGVALSADASKSDPTSGKSCVSLLSYERTTTGLLLMHYRNTCSSPFEIRITTAEKTRRGTIEAGTPDKPAKGTVTCRSSDACESADWEFDLPKGS